MPKFVRQANNTLSGSNTFTGTNTFSGSLVASGGITGDVTGNLTGNVTGNVAGVISGTRPVAAQATGTKAVQVAESGTMFVDTQGASTTTFTLPAAAAGLWYTFVCGSAAGEILITPQTGDAIVCKVAPHTDATALAPAAGTGIRNTAAGNVVGDMLTLVALDATTWYGVAQAGAWTSQ